LSETPQYEDEIDLKELIITLLSGWKIILASTVTIAIIATIYAKTLPSQYVVTTKAASLGGGGGASSQMAGLAALAGVSMGAPSKEVDLLEHIDVVIKNSFFMDRLLAKKWILQHTLTKDEKRENLAPYLDTVTFEEYWNTPAPDTTVANSKYRRKMSLYGRLRSGKLNHLSVVNSGGILEVKTKFDNPQLAYQVHMELLSLLRHYFKNDYTNRDKEKRVFIEERLDEVKKRLKSAESQLIRHQEKNIMTTSPRVILTGERLIREVELQAELYKELIKQLEIAKIDEKKETLVFEVLQEAELPLGPSEPNRKLLKIIGVILGGAFGVFVVFAIEWVKSFFIKEKFEVSNVK
jgi:hypothetical protein